MSYRSQGSLGHRAHNANEVPRAVLEFRNDRPETLLALAQRHSALLNALFQIAYRSRVNRNPVIRIT
jgi:hypothetical protein